LVPWRHGEKELVGAPAPFARPRIYLPDNIGVPVEVYIVVHPGDTFSGQVDLTNLLAVPVRSARADEKPKFSAKLTFSLYVEPAAPKHRELRFSWWYDPSFRHTTITRSRKKEEYQLMGRFWDPIGSTIWNVLYGDRAKLMLVSEPVGLVPMGARSPKGKTPQPTLGRNSPK
jgi:hypothetical protein